MTDILSHIDAGVMTLTFNRVDKKNSLTAAMYTALADAVEQAKHDSNVRVLVFQGHEAVFCAGNDIADFLNDPPSSQDAPVFRLLRNIGISKACVGRRGWPCCGYRHHVVVSL